MVKVPQVPAMPGMTPLGVKEAPAPDYIVTRESYGRTERVADVERFANDLSKALGGQPIIKGDESYRDRFAQFRLADGTVIGVSRTHQAWDMVSISIDAGLKLSDNDRPSGEKYKMPSAKVAVTRPFARIVADIKRRVIDAAQAPLAELRAYGEMVGKRSDDLNATAERLRADHPGLSVSIKDNSTYKGSIYRNSEGWPYLSGTFYADGTVSLDRLGSLTAEQFDRVCSALYND
jgi:hypothetical protein